MVSMNSHLTLSKKKKLQLFYNNQKLFFRGTERVCSVAYSWVACCRYVGQLCWTSHCWLQTCGLFWFESLRTMRRSALSMHISLHMVINSLTELYWILIKAVFFRSWPGRLDLLRCLRRHGGWPPHLLIQVCCLKAVNCCILTCLHGSVIFCHFSWNWESSDARRSSKEAEETAQVAGASDEHGKAGDEEAGMQNPAWSSCACISNKGSSLTAWEYTYLQGNM